MAGSTPLAWRSDTIGAHVHTATGRANALLPTTLLQSMSPEAAAATLVSAVVQPSSSQPSSRGAQSFRGVTTAAVTGDSLRPVLFRATINHSGKTIDIGGYETELAAARAYDEAARRLHGERARLNFPSPGERSSMGRSTYRGISWQGKCQKWEVRIKHEGKMRYVGVFADEDVAAAAWDIEAMRLRGISFRNLNFLSNVGQYVAALSRGMSSAEAAYAIGSVDKSDAGASNSGRSNVVGIGEAQGTELAARVPRNYAPPAGKCGSPAPPPPAFLHKVTTAGAGYSTMAPHSSFADATEPAMEYDDFSGMYPPRNRLKRGLETSEHLSPRSKVNRASSSSPNSTSEAAGPALQGASSSPSSTSAASGTKYPAFLMGGLTMGMAPGSDLLGSSSSSGTGHGSVKGLGEHQDALGHGAARQLHHLLRPMLVSPPASGLQSSAQGSQDHDGGWAGPVGAGHGEFIRLQLGIQAAPEMQDGCLQAAGGGIRTFAFFSSEGDAASGHANVFGANQPEAELAGAHQRSFSGGALPSLPAMNRL